MKYFVFGNKKVIKFNRFEANTEDLLKKFRIISLN
jgi:hypothetical protein